MSTLSYPSRVCLVKVNDWGHASHLTAYPAGVLVPDDRTVALALDRSERSEALLLKPDVSAAGLVLEKARGWEPNSHHNQRRHSQNEAAMAW